MRHVTRRDGKPFDHYITLAYILILGGIIGARLFYVFTHVEEFSGNWGAMFNPFQSGQFGIAEVDSDFRIVAFREKPKEEVRTIPGDPNHVLASMGIYVFRTETLLDMLKEGQEDDFGRDIIPKMLDSHQIFAYPYVRFNRIEDYVYFTTESGDREIRLEERVRDSSYWRDVGTLDAYWNANMDLTGVDPYFNLYGTKWPIHTRQVLAPPAKFIFNNERPEGFRVGKALDSLVAPGCIVSGIVRNSILAHNVIVRS